MRHVALRPDCFLVSPAEYSSQHVRRRDRYDIVSPLTIECDCTHCVFTVDSCRRLNSFNEGAEPDLGKRKIKKNEFFFQHSNPHERTARPRLDGWKEKRRMRPAHCYFLARRGAQSIRVNSSSATVVAEFSRSFFGRTPVSRPRRQSSGFPSLVVTDLVEDALYSGFYGIFPIATVRWFLHGERLGAGAQTHQFSTSTGVVLLLLARGR